MNVKLHRIFNKTDVIMLPLIKNKLRNVSSVHLSIDDVKKCFEDLKNSNIPLREHPFFAKLKELNTKYGAKFTLYCFDDYACDIASERVAELAEMSSWLSLGWHGSLKEGNTIGSFKKFISFYKDTGVILSSVLRLHRFYADEKTVSFLKENGIKTLLCSDNKGVSYGKDYTEYSVNNKTTFYRETDIRLENFVTARITSLKKEDLYIFAHEVPFMLYNEFEKLDLLLKMLPKCKFLA